MRHLLSLGLGAYLTAFVAVGSVHAACPTPQGVSLVVPPGATAFYLDGVPLPPSGGTSTVIATTLHGSLTNAGGDWIYSPNSSFWTLGSDRFVLQQVGSGRTEVVTVRLFAEIKQSAIRQQDFEIPLPPGGDWELVGDSAAATIVSSVRMNGHLGLSLTVQTGQSAAVTRGDEIRGDGSQGSGATGGWKPPGGPRGLVESESAQATLLSQVDDGDNPVVWVRMQHNDLGVSVRLETEDTPANATWHTVSEADHQLTLISSAPPHGPTGRAMLFIDGKHIDTIESADITPNLIEGQRFEFGLRDLEGSNLTSGFDQLATFLIVPDELPATVECSDSFETSFQPVGWHQFNATNIASVTPGLVGTRALAVQVNGPGTPLGGLVIANDLASKNLGRLGARFEFDTREISLPAGATLLLVDSENTIPTRSFRILLDGLANGNQRLRVIARHDDITTPVAVAYVPLSNGRHTLELDWRRSPANAAAMGYLRVWMDGQPFAEHLQIRNPGQVLKDFRVGATTQAGQPSGQLLLDNLEVWSEPY